MAELEEELMFEYDSDDEKEKIQKEKEEAERARLAAQLLYDEDENGEKDNGVKEVTEKLDQENNGEVDTSKSQHAAIDTDAGLGVEKFGSDYKEVKGNTKPQLPKAAGSVFSRLGPREPISNQNEIENKQMYENCQDHNESFGGAEEKSPARIDEEEKEIEDEDEEEEEEEDDDSRRARFKSERSSVSRSISLTTDKPKWNIPDTLDDVITPHPNMDQMMSRNPRHNPYQRGWDNPYQRGWENPYQRGMESPYQRGIGSPYQRSMESPYQRGMESPYQRSMESPYQRGYEDPYQRNWEARSARFGMYGPNNGIRSLMDNAGMDEQQLQNQNSFILSPHSPQLRPIQQPEQPQQSKLSSIKSRLSIPNSKLKGLQTKTDATPVAASQSGNASTKDKQQTTTVASTGKVMPGGKSTGKIVTPTEVQATPGIKRPHANNVSDNTAQAKQIKLEIPYGKNPISLLHETFKGGTVKFLEQQIGTVPHNPEFECNVDIKGDKYYGVGKSKKVARLKAAEAAVLALMQAGVIPMEESVADMINPGEPQGGTTASHGEDISSDLAEPEHGIPPVADISTAGGQTTTSLKSSARADKTPPNAEVPRPPGNATSPTETHSRTFPETPHVDNTVDTTDSAQQIELEIPTGKNVISILHEMLGNRIRFIDKNLGLVHAPEFECSVTLDGQTYRGIGKQKKVAKKKAGEAMLLGLMQDWINGKYANISMAGTQTMNQLVDAHFRRQQQNGGPRQTATSIIK